MDSQGFVKLDPITKFNRIKNLRATVHQVWLTYLQYCHSGSNFFRILFQILEALLSSDRLEIVVPAEVETAKGNESAMAALSASVILETRIRTVDNPLDWVRVQSPALDK